MNELPYGRQRLVEIAMALGLQPTVLLLDEPAAGVPSAESAIILDVIEQLPRDIAVLIIEHDMELVFRFARRITVLVQGSVLVEGPPAEIAADPRVREVYLGDAASWLTASRCMTCPPAMARPWCSSDVSLARGRGRHAGGARPQRRRQDDAAGDHAWATRRCTPDGSRSAASRSSACVLSARAARHRLSCRRSARSSRR